MQSKKGVYALFWGIGVLIIGGLTLIFFLSYLTTNTKISTSTLSQEVIARFNNIMKLSLTSQNKLQEISIGVYPIKLGCEDNETTINIGNSYLFESNFAIFGEKRMSAENLEIWTLTPEIPFRIKPIILINEVGNPFLFCSQQNNDLMNKLYEDFKIKNKKKGCQSEGNEDEVLITTGNVNNPRMFKRVIKIEIEEQQPLLFGNVTIYENNKEDKFPFIGKEMLFASIVSNKKVYECNINLVNRDIENMGRIIKKTLIEINQSLSNYDPTKSSACSSIYNSIKNYFDRIENTNLESKKRWLKEISNKNNRLIEQGCPTTW